MKVLLFARARDLVGASHVDVKDTSTVGELRLQLMTRFPKLAGLLEKSALAVNGEFAENDTPILPGAEVALLPPVSGG
jgi:molybdopterin converting factor subunit 1